MKQIEINLFRSLEGSLHLCSHWIGGFNWLQKIARESKCTSWYEGQERAGERLWIWRLDCTLYLESCCLAKVWLLKFRFCRIITQTISTFSTKHFSPSPNDIAHIISAAKQASAGNLLNLDGLNERALAFNLKKTLPLLDQLSFSNNALIFTDVYIAQQRVAAAKEEVLEQQRLAKEKEAHALIATQKAESAQQMLRSEAQNVVFAQQKLAKAKSEASEISRIASLKESEAAAALTQSAQQAYAEIQKAGE